MKVVELLLAKGANKEHRNISDYTPLSQASSGGYVNVIKVLLAHGAEINSRSVTFNNSTVSSLYSASWQRLGLLTMTVRQGIVWHRARFIAYYTGRV